MVSNELNGLPPPPPGILNVVPEHADAKQLAKKKIVRVPEARRWLGIRGQKIPLLTNHFEVQVTNSASHFYNYSVAIFYENGHPVEGEVARRRVLDKVYETYKSELAGKEFGYDGEMSLFTAGALPQNKFEFTVVLENVPSNRNYGNGNASPDGDEGLNESDKKRFRRTYQSKTFRVEISLAAKIPMQVIANALRGQETVHSQEDFQVLDIILRQPASKQGCLLVRQSFHNDPKNFTGLGGRVLGCRGFRTTQGGLSLNIDASTTMIIQPGPVADFLVSNQNARDPFSLDWAKAKRVLKNLRITVSPSNIEYKITGLSEKPCNEQTFQLKRKGKGDGDREMIELTVYDYFVNYRNIKLSYSGNLPCINVGKPKKPTFFPLELCSLISLQRYTKALTTNQRASLVEKSRQKPQERMSTLSYALNSNNYDAEPMLKSCGISTGKNFTQIEGRVLPTPKLNVGNGEILIPRNGRWNFNNKKLVEPVKIEKWAVANFSARCDIQNLIRGLCRCGEMKGIRIEPPLGVFEESTQFRCAPPLVRVEKMLEKMQAKLHRKEDQPQFLLCLLPEKKNSDLYGPWKRRNLSDFGIVTQCIAPTRVNDQYLTNVILKINAKLGGLNSLLAVEHFPSIPLVSKTPTIIFGMNVSHGSPGHSTIPSIAAVVGSRQWPLVSRYRASVRTQSPKVEMITSLFKKVSDVIDEGIIRELLLEFYTSSQKRKPDQIIIFRDGVSESQFNQVLNIEFDQIIEACKFLDTTWSPKFLLIVAQKNHHTKFFQAGGSLGNVPPGTIIDNKICHPRNKDFYLCAHAGMIGTTRPTHYHVLLDELGFSPDDLQELVHSLSYVYQRSTTAISVVAPICYAYLAATHVGSIMKFEDTSETSSIHGKITSPGPVLIPELPRLAAGVCNSMFFC